MRRLQTVSVLTSSSISRQLSLFQYGREVIVDLEAGSIHLKTEDEGLQIYLPWRGGDRDLCLKSQIPKRMMSFLGITDPAAEAVLGNIINLKRLSSVVALLQNEGVVDVDGLTPTDLDDEDEHSDNESEVNTLGSTLVMTPASTPRPTPQLMPYTPPRSGSRRPEYGALDPGTPTFTHTIPADPPTGQVVEALSPLHNRAGVQTGYSAILERVRSASDGLLPGQGTVRLYPTGATPTQLAVTFESLFPSRSMDRDRKVGAAGELFVRMTRSPSEICTNLSSGL